MCEKLIIGLLNIILLLHSTFTHTPSSNIYLAVSHEALLNIPSGDDDYYRNSLNYFQLKVKKLFFHKYFLMYLAPVMNIVCN